MHRPPVVPSRHEQGIVRYHHRRHAADNDQFVQQRSDDTGIEDLDDRAHETFLGPMSNPALVRVVIPSKGTTPFTVRQGTGFIGIPHGAQRTDTVTTTTLTGTGCLQWPCRLKGRDGRLSSNHEEAQHREDSIILKGLHDSGNVASASVCRFQCQTARRCVSVLVGRKNLEAMRLGQVLNNVAIDVLFLSAASSS